MAQLPDSFGPRDISVALPDTRYADRMDIRLQELGVSAFDPSGEALAHHPLFSLLRAFRSFAGVNRWADFRRVAVHEHVLQWLGHLEGFNRLAWLKALDAWHADSLPINFDSWVQRLHNNQNGMKPKEKALLPAVTALQTLKQNVEAQPDVRSAIQHLCSVVYEHRKVSRNEEKDDAFRQAAESLQKGLEEWKACEVSLSMFEAWGLILRALARDAVYTERSENSVALEGWLELHWSPAPVLIVTGMHEGHVPDTRMDDMFLPESLRTTLGLQHDAERFARDAFLYESGFQCRQKQGAVHMVMGRLGPDQEPLKPSRLLLAAHDTDEMMKRCDLFFGPDVHEVELPDLTRPSLTLDPSRAEVKREFAGEGKTLSVGALGAYLKCPFTFYLQKVLRMDAVDSAKSELAATDFGTLIHDALTVFSDPKVAAMQDGHALAGCLQGELERLALERYGEDRPLFLRIQLDTIKQRLNWVAQREAELRQVGWETIHTELPIEQTLNGIRLSGRIDRVDRHADGRVRIIDYKSSANPVSPLKAHVGSSKADGKEYRLCPDGKTAWQDLQLPIYLWMYQQVHGKADDIDPAYFNIPKAVRDTGLYCWEGFNSAWMDSAVNCATGVIHDIQNWQFWPPQKDGLKYDLGEIFPASLENVIDHMSFEKFLAAQRGEAKA